MLVDTFSAFVAEDIGLGSCNRSDERHFVQHASDKRA
jgi:hypothetical protein